MQVSQLAVKIINHDVLIGSVCVCLLVCVSFWESCCFQQINPPIRAWVRKQTKWWLFSKVFYCVISPVMSLSENLTVFTTERCSLHHYLVMCSFWWLNSNWFTVLTCCIHVYLCGWGNGWQCLPPERQYLPFQILITDQVICCIVWEMLDSHKCSLATTYAHI